MPSETSELLSQLGRLHEASSQHLDQVQLDCPEGRAVLTLEADLGTWLQVLSDRPETQQYRSAHRDLGLSFFSTSLGLYRQGFAGLRSFIEVSFGALHLSSSEYQRRKWIAGRRDLSWSEITSVDNGLFSQDYVKVFMPSAEVESTGLLTDIKAAYRTCSEYLHGNVQTSDLLPETITLSEDLVNQWLRTARTALRIFHHSLFVRYYLDLNSDQKNRLEAPLEEHFSNSYSVRTELNLPIGKD
ncbi:hypothetical protein [Citricoccus sp.]|uniref:hypothetical protein n=1 Tax=Citricoccus sp. TaxID=1978372 RepID=UPI0028BD397D|nr:hypothetical protein [Citricoccus sp.]